MENPPPTPLPPLPAGNHRFLNVDEYVIHLYDKYGEGGGILSRKTFGQVCCAYIIYSLFEESGLSVATGK